MRGRVARRGLAWSLLAAAAVLIIAVTPSVANAAPNNGADPSASLLDRFTSEGPGVVVPEKSGKARTFTFAPEENGLAAAEVVTCTVFHSGPYSIGGLAIGFNVDVLCDGEVDLLKTKMAMVQYSSAGGVIGIPSSYRNCELLATGYLPCATSTACSFAAEYYWGIAQVDAYLGAEHEQLLLATPARAFACAV